MAEYQIVTDTAIAAFTTDPEVVAQPILDRISELSHDQRYEAAAVHRDRLLAYLRSAARTQRLAALSSISELVAAQPTPDRGWEIHVIRYGRLAGADRVPPRIDPMPYIDSLVAVAEHIEPGLGPKPAGLPEEAECLLRWLTTTGVRLVSLTGEWAVPIASQSQLNRLSRADKPQSTQPDAAGNTPKLHSSHNGANQHGP